MTQPTTTTHHGLTPEERARRGISEAMLRLSVGLEDAADLIADDRCTRYVRLVVSSPDGVSVAVRVAAS